MISAHFTMGLNLSLSIELNNKYARFPANFLLNSLRVDVIRTGSDWLYEHQLIVPNEPFYRDHRRIDERTAVQKHSTFVWYLSRVAFERFRFRLAPILFFD